MWRSRIFWQLFGTYSVLLLVSLGLIGWLVLRRLEEHARQTIRQGLLDQADLIAAQLASGTQTPQELAAFAAHYGKQGRSRLTLIRRDGAVVADSAEEPARMENHGDRPEVHEARDRTVGVAIRHSHTVGQDFMYLAKRINTAEVGFVRVATPLDQLDSELSWLRQMVLLAGGFTLLAAGLLSLLLARRMSAPLIELAEAARKISEGGHGLHAGNPGRGEIGVLTRAFNEMSDACASHIHALNAERDQLQAVFRSMIEGVVVIDAEQRVQFLNEAAARLLNLGVESANGRKLWQSVRHRQLADAVDQVLAKDEPFSCEFELNTSEPRLLAVHGVRLPGEPQRGAVLVFHDNTHVRHLERVRQDFVSNVSHELKTPLAAIQATVETLLDGAIHDSEHNLRFLERIRENTDRLYRQVQDLLILGRIESGQEMMELEELPLHEAVQACVSRQEPRAQAKSLRLELLPAPGTVTVLADDEALAQILDNLVDNAIKYTPPQGRVTLRWFAEGSQSVLQVEDTGVGIPEKDLGRIFERFYRVDKARSRQLGGTGLGLAIVKHLAQVLGGSISVTSELGAGSTFTLRLPRGGS